MQRIKVMDFSSLCYNMLNCFCMNLFYVLTFFLFHSSLSSHNSDLCYIMLWGNTLDDMSLPTNIALCLFVILPPSCSLLSVLLLSCQHTYSSHNFNWLHIIFYATPLINMCLSTDFSLCLFVILSPSCCMASRTFSLCLHTCSSSSFDCSHIIFWANIMINICHPTEFFLFLFLTFSPSCRPISIIFLSCQHNCSSYNLDWLHIILLASTLTNLFCLNSTISLFCVFTCRSHNFDCSNLFWSYTLNIVCLTIDIYLYLFVFLSPSCMLFSITLLSCQHTYSSHKFYWSHIVNLAYSSNIMSHPTNVSLYLFEILLPLCSLISVIVCHALTLAAHLFLIGATLFDPFLWLIFAIPLIFLFLCL